MTLKIGSHVSMKAKKFLVGSVEETLENNSNTMMIYTGAPQSSRRTSTDKLFIEDMKVLWNENKLTDIIIHAPYIINLGNTVDESKFNFGVEFLSEELRRSSKIGGKCVVLHPGAHVGAGEDKGLNQIIKGLDMVFENTSDLSIKIALETMAGKGTELAKNFEEINYIISNSKYSERLSVCFDTCHINDSGYDIKNNFDDVLNEFDNIIGLNKIDVIHLNDSKNEMGAKKDRHENIGYGTIGFDALVNIAFHEKLSSIPKILETPYINKTTSPYKEEIKMIKSKKFNDFISEIIKENNEKE